MAKEGVVVGLDIGTSKVAAVICEVDDSGQIEVLGVGVAPSKGLRKGMVVNLESTTDSIRKAVSSAEMVAGLKVKSVFAGIAGEHIRGQNSHSIVIIPNRKNKSRQISSADVKRAIEQAKDIEIPVDRKILDAIPREFIVDDQDGILEPVGMVGTRLESLVHLITGSVSSIQNIIKAIENADLDAEDIMLQPLASSEAVLYQDEKEMGVILIDIGAGTTDIVIYIEGSVWYTAVIPIGGDLVTNDIAIGLRTPIGRAEDIKKNSGSALMDMVGANEMIEVPGVGGRNPKMLPRRILAGIIEPRMRELLEFVHEEIKTSGYNDMTPAGVVITGGTSMLYGISQLAEDIFGVQVRVGYPREVKGLFSRIKDPSFATGVGLVLRGVKQHGTGSGIKSYQFPQIFKMMRNWFSSYF